MARVSPQGGRSPSAARPAWCTTRVSAGRPRERRGGRVGPGWTPRERGLPPPRPRLPAGTPGAAARMGRGALWGRRGSGPLRRPLPGSLGWAWRSCRCPVAVGSPRYPRLTRSLFNEGAFPTRVQPSFWGCTGERPRADAGAQAGAPRVEPCGSQRSRDPWAVGRPGPEPSRAPRVL